MGLHATSSLDELPHMFNYSQYHLGMCIILVLSSVYILIALGGPNKFLVGVHVRLSIQWKAKMLITGYGHGK